MVISDVTGIIALVISVVGVYLVVRQLKMARKHRGSIGSRKHSREA